MYMMKGRKNTRWTIARARQQLPSLIAAAAREPQAVYRRTQLVATVVGPELAARIEAGSTEQRPPMADALAELRRICAEERYNLSTGPRHDRSNPAARRR